MSKLPGVARLEHVGINVARAKWADLIAFYENVFGWHIIRVDDKRTKQPPAFEQVKDQIETYVQRKAQADLIQKLRAEAKIEKIGGDKPADPAPAAPAAKPDSKAPAKK